MAIEKQVRYSSIVDEKLRSEFPILTNGLFNTKYEGNPKAGAVKIPVTSEATASDYDAMTGTALTQANVSYITLNLTQDKAINELIRGYEASAVPLNMVADRLEAIAYAMGLTMEKYLTTILEAQGTTTTSAVSTELTAYTNVLKARTALSKAKVPKKNRWLLVSPEFYALLLEDSKFVKASDIGQTMLKEGVIGRIAGFDVYESTELNASTEFIAGHSQNASFVREWLVEPELVDIKDGVHINTSKVQTNYIYDAKITQATSIQIKAIG